MHGKGIYTYSNGDHYEGILIKYCFLKYLYKGEWEYDKKQVKIIKKK